MTRGCACFFMAVWAASGCAARPRNDVRSNMDLMQKETASDKLLERGRAFAAIGDFTRAEQYLSLALEAGADPSAALPLLLRACVEGERYLAALEYGRYYAARKPDDSRLLFVVATLEAAIGDPKLAANELRAVLRARPDDPDVHYALACLLRDGNVGSDEAAAHFREYLRLSPEGPHAAEARASVSEATP
jgi:tetratricopeptide (TPR) repeat protein